MTRHLVVLCGTAIALAAQTNPISDSARNDYTSVRNYAIRSAEEMPEANYGFKPTPEIRSFGQQIAHIADDQYNYCTVIRGEVRKAAYTALEDSLTTKAELVKAVKEAFASCDPLYESLTDATAGEMIKGPKRSRPRLGILAENTRHTWLHYGNLVVYLRLKGLVPPSSK